MKATHSSFFSAFVPGCIGTAGLWLGMANPLAHFPLLALLYPAALAFLGFQAERRRLAFRHGWLTGIAASSACLYWIAVPVHEVAGQPLPLAAACALLLGTYVGLYAGLFSLTAFVCRAFRPWRKALALCLAWFLLEWLRGWLFTGFPWLALASAFVPWTIWIQGASIVGAYLLGGVFTALAVLLMIAMTEKKVRLRCVAGAACIALALTGYGAWRLDALDAQGTHDVQAPDGNVEHAGDRLPVVFVQGNIDQNQKWDRAFIDSTLEIYTGLSPAWSPESQERRPLVIWPETAMPFDYLSSGFGKDIRSFAAQNNIWLLFGAPGVIRDTRGESLLLNRAYLLGPDGRNYGTYEKEHLVPFGEFVPPWLNIPFLEPLLQGIGDFMPGTAVKPLVLADALIPDLIPEEEGALSARAGTARLALGILICYETIFPELSRQRVADGAEVLINISNDAWFGRSSAPEQHLQLSALGAVEQKRFIARGTNTGISAIIDPAGRILFRSELFVTGAFAGSVTPRMDKTVFYHMFPWLVPAALAGFILLVPRPFRRRNIHT